MVICENHSHMRTAGWWQAGAKFVCVHACFVRKCSRAHTRCHHSSNQPLCEPDWIINYPINASLHSVRLSASKYLPMQNNPRRLDYHFKLSLSVAHNQRWVGVGLKFCSFASFLCKRPPPQKKKTNHHKHHKRADAGEEGVFGRRGYKTSLPCGFGG